MSWTETMAWCIANEIEFTASFAETSNIYDVRNSCLVGDVRRGKYQKPFNGEVEYDYIVWIDSDQVWEPQILSRLLSHNKDIVGGYAAVQGGSSMSCGEYDPEAWKTGPMKQYQELELIAKADENGLVEVGFNGFPFTLVKRGVLETFEFPWFCQRGLCEVTTEDGIELRAQNDDAVDFCLEARRLGYKIWVDTKVRIGHEKSCVY